MWVAFLFQSTETWLSSALQILSILVTVMLVKRYAFTSLWCAYAAVASVIILAYFWKSQRHRPFLYAESM